MSNLGARGGTVITRADAGRVRLNDAGQRREIVLNAAIRVAKSKGIGRLNWPDVAAACRVQTSIITARRCYLSLVELRRAVVERAQAAGDSDLIAQGKDFGLITE